VCGIAGLVAIRAPSTDGRSMVERMTAALDHRGPDDVGVFAENQVALGHRRLAILDLSSAGHQPMISADGRFVLVFNGEIYNFRELRNRLNYPFRSNCDSEVLLAAWEIWGPACLKELVGMYAFAVWDRNEQQLHLVRDRLGIKPLYYFQSDDYLLFSSEIRSLLASGVVPRRLDRDSLVDYLRYQCVHQPHTIVAGIRMLEPASHAVLSGGATAVERYWSPLYAAPREPMTPKLAREQVFSALLTAVERRLVSDVPFGAFLSGGIDSSAVVALMRQVRDQVSTFSVSFAEDAYSEAPYATAVAKKFHTDHHDIHLSPNDFLALLPEALDRMDHPSGDGPNTYVVSRATKRAGITMALSGLGGDELFAGYPVFRKGLRLSRYRALNAIPWQVRRAAARVVEILRPGIASAKLGRILAQERISLMTAYPFYRQVFLDQQIELLLRVSVLPTNRVANTAQALWAEPGFTELPGLSQISVLEMSTYLQNVLLRDTDQMSMAHALEVRVPFLDHELVELVLAIPDVVKYRSTPKHLLVDALGDLLPPEIVNRPKMGFTLPYAQWMRRELRGFCESRLWHLAERGTFGGDTILRFWSDFQADRPTISWSRLWMLVALEHWLERNGIE
jgi:asparagine synthase (glutamine-hydrolysing)